MTIPDLVRYADADALAEATAGRLVAAVVEAQEQREFAHVVLTGGGIGTSVLAALSASPTVLAIDWQRVHLWWGDERYLPTGHLDRNDTSAHQVLIDHVAIPRDQVHSMLGPDRSESAEMSARHYEEALLSVGNGVLPRFDVVLLGIGPDAHVASLFPEHPQTYDERIAVCVHNSPKPPPIRVTLTFSTLNHSRQAWILASGEEKSKAVRLALDPLAGPRQIPASGIKAEHTSFLVDFDAAKKIPADFGRPGA